MSAEPIGPVGGTTRERILEAARGIILEEGFGELSLERVAERAGVVRATIYYQFGSRAGLLEALVGAAEERGEVHKTREEDHTVRDLFNRVIRIWEDDADVIRGFLTMAVADEQARAVVDRHQRGRRQRIIELVDDFDRVGQLRCHRQDAIDLLWLLTSFHSYDFVRYYTDRDVGEARHVLEIAFANLVAPEALGVGSDGGEG
ncbi:MAG: TetR/AcrR family transcriptional regulator [Nitriliruptorales bacterium]|nr:TetR/AcrR family transcriptional regulator [Nitriliruptorales bacterium]